MVFLRQIAGFGMYNILKEVKADALSLRICAKCVEQH